MKTSIIPAALFALGLMIPMPVQAAVTFSVYKASAALPLNYEGPFADGKQPIIKKKLASKDLINLAMGLPSKTKVPKNIILACAGPNNFDQASSGDTPAAPVQLIVWDTAANGGVGGKVAKIGDLGTRDLVVQLGSYKRLGVCSLTFAAVGVAGNRIVSGDLAMQGVLTHAPTPVGPKPNIKGNGGGKMVLDRDGLVIPLAIVHKASISSSGLPIGSFTE